MIQVDAQSMVLVVLGAIGGLLFSWAGKHLLDWLLLRRIRDWWAGKSKRKALNRIEQIMNQYENELLYATDARYTVAASELRICVLICTLFVMACLTLPLIIKGSNLSTSMDFFSFLMAGGALAFLFAFGSIHNKNMKLFRDASPLRDNAIARLKPLLKKTGLTDVEIDQWLENVPKIPVQ